MKKTRNNPKKPEPQVKAVIFDCWNTLFYVKGGRGSWMNRMGRTLFRRRFGYRYMKSLERSLMVETRPTPEAARALLKDLRLPAWPELIRRVERMIETPAHERLAYADTFEVLKELKKRGYKIGMITNTFEQAFKPLKQEFELDKYFDVIVTSYDTGLLKPDYRIFKRALEQLGVEPAEAVMVGDTLRDDIRAAHAAGLKGYLIDRRERYPHNVDRIDSLSDLLQKLPKH